MQYEDEHVLLQHIHTLLLQQQDDFHIAAAAESAIINSNDQYLDNNNNNIDNSNSNARRFEDSTTTTAMMMMNNVVGKKGKKCSKKDRHSKIHTAHGPRDRRMRLSLDVARKFFDLQDMLGFDKASKTVDWLLMKSRLAIKDLKQQKHSGGSSAAAAAGSASSTSECEAASGVLDQEFEPPMGDNGMDAGKLSMPADGSKDKKAKPGRVRAAFHPLAKESRNKARERARERTKMKNMLGETQAACLQEMGGGTRNVKTTNDPPSDQVLPPAAAAEEELATSHIHENNWSLSNIFHCHQNPPATATATSHEVSFNQSLPYPDFLQFHISHT